VETPLVLGAIQSGSQSRDHIGTEYSLLIKTPAPSCDFPIVQAGQECSYCSGSQVYCQSEGYIPFSFIAAASFEYLVGINHDRREYNAGFTLYSGPASKPIVEGDLSLSQVLQFYLIWRCGALFNQYLAFSTGSSPCAGLFQRQAGSGDYLTKILTILRLQGNYL
jgi:hypothetical protein